ncbi:hypothetical protein SB778_03935 [Paraburkholderia sp. SIMBA_050]
MTTPKFELLKDAYAIVEGIPEENFLLDTWRTKDQGASCGTIACAGGWLTLHPKFRELGLSTDSYDFPNRFNHFPTFRGETHNKALATFFCITEDDADVLFRQRTRYEREGTDKELFLRRLRSFLEKRGQLNEQLERRAQQQAVAQRALMP